jgi:hypothetical protein
VSHPISPRPICPRCNLTIERGEEFHPTAEPFHVPCREHGRCHVLCPLEDHPDFVEWYRRTFKRDPVQRVRA